MAQVAEVQVALPTRLSELAIDSAHPLNHPCAAAPAVSTAGHAPQLVTQLWNVLAYHRMGQLDQAQRAWEEINLREEDEVWRQLGISMCEMTLGNFEAADVSLETAHLLAPRNPITHYLLGIYHIARIDQGATGAALAADAKIRLVAVASEDHADPPRMTHLWHAEYHFERAIELAETVCEDAPLVTPEVDMATAGGAEPRLTERVVATPAPPSLGDYLDAVGCGNYVANSHLGLALLCMERQALDRAEHNLAHATALGLGVQDEWLALGAAYGTASRHLDAARAYLSAIGRGHAFVRPMREAFRSLVQAGQEPG